MTSLTVLYGMDLADEAFEPLLDGKSAFDLALERASAFGSGRRLLLAPAINSPCSGWERFELPRNTVSELLKVLSQWSEGADLGYFAWADAPFLDPVLTQKLTARHLQYHADYSYADGWPYGLAPELLAPGVAGILHKIAAADGEKMITRDSIFKILQKDINSFDIETELSSVDLRYLRLSLTADSRRNLLGCRRFAGCDSAGDVEKICVDHPEFIRTLPAFFPIQVSGVCPKEKPPSCGLCPYPASGLPRDGFMEPGVFSGLLDKISAFAADAVIDLSLWGEAALHPYFAPLAADVLERPSLSLVIETASGGWEPDVLQAIAQNASALSARRSGLSALSWIVSASSTDLPESESPVAALVKKLCAYFPAQSGEEKIYIQTIRVRGDEDAVERFYRAWKKFAADNPVGIIVLKYDSFCGLLADRVATDLSPVTRRPCWHLMRDFPILLDGRVPVCREDVELKMNVYGNAFVDDLAAIWERGTERCLAHCSAVYSGLCAKCDEYYTFNF
ncbi:MAG: spiro-SPASM protein [Treponema sp.]|nr:spiro-SPASM protein [Treponema sp.]